MTSLDCEFSDDKFESGMQVVLQTDKKDFPAIVGGLMIASGVEFSVGSPLDDSITFGKFQEPEKGIAGIAVDAALKAFNTWSKTSVESRLEIFTKVRRNLMAQKYILAATILVNAGMGKSEAVCEVERMISILNDGCEKLADIKNPRPNGVWGIISAHNSPLASPMGYALSAMLAGDTVVVMPSRYCPIPVYRMYDILTRCGLPEGVMNIIVDNKDDSYIALANDERLEGVIASGSGKLMEDMMFLQVDDELRFVNEIKGMNPILVHKPGDVKKSASTVLDSAFRYMGQHLYSTSKIIITEADQEKFTNQLIEQMKDLVIDDPALPDVFTGPMISREAESEYLNFIEENRGYVIYGGKKVKGEFLDFGCYVTPALMTGGDEESDMDYMDLGFPILCIKVVPDLDAAFEELTVTECGLSAAILSKDQNAIDRFLEEAMAPNKVVNKSTLTLNAALEADINVFLK